MSTENMTYNDYILNLTDTSPTSIVLVVRLLH
jgi:hypothetical protein